MSQTGRLPENERLWGFGHKLLSEKINFFFAAPRLVVEEEEEKEEVMLVAVDGGEWLHRERVSVAATA